MFGWVDFFFLFMKKVQALKMRGRISEKKEESSKTSSWHSISIRVFFKRGRMGIRRLKNVDIKIQPKKTLLKYVFQLEKRLSGVMDILIDVNGDEGLNEFPHQIQYTRIHSLAIDHPSMKSSALTRLRVELFHLSCVGLLRKAGRPSPNYACVPRRDCFLLPRKGLKRALP